MVRPRRRILGVVLGLLWGVGAAVLVAMYGLRPLDPLVLYGIPALAAFVSALWTGRRGRAATLAVVVLGFPAVHVTADLVAQEGCAVSVNSQSLPGRTTSNPVVVDADEDVVYIELELDGVAEGRAWVKLGGIEVPIADGEVDGYEYWEFTRDGLQWFDAPGLYEVGGSAGGCSGSGFVRVEGNPLAHPLGQGAAAAVALGLMGTGLAGRAPAGSHGRTGTGTGDAIEQVERPESAEKVEPQQPEPEAEHPETQEQAEAEPEPETEAEPEQHDAQEQADTEAEAETETQPEADHVETTPLPGLPTFAARQMEATLFDQATGRALTGFVAGATHRIEVRIGAATAEWATAAGLDALGRQRLRIVLTEPNLLPEPRVGAVDLGGAGASSLATFELETRPDTAAVDARLIAVEGNRILHTSRLPDGLTTSVETQAAGTAPLNVARLESVTAAAVPTAGRRRMDAALLVNHSVAGTPRLTAIADEAVAAVAVDGLATAVGTISQLLEEIVSAPDDFVELGSEGSVEVMVALANHGAMLRSFLVTDVLEQLATATSIQVVSATADAYFPLELAYDFPAPNEDAVLCPGAQRAMADPRPTAGCDADHDRTTVCPLGFWSLSKVIERHAHQPGQDVDGRFLLRTNPTAERFLLAPGDVLFAASDRVDGFTPGAVDAVADTLSRLSYGHAVQARKWDEWIADVADRPALMLLLPHTVYSDTLRTAGLEIATSERMWKSHIDSNLVPPDDRPVIAVLLGCETAVDESVTYESFPGVFRRAGVEVVIGTLTEILGRHAAPIAETLADEIFRAWREPPTRFGEAMVGLRRRALARGLLPVLAVVAFGDADWLLGPAGVSPGSPPATRSVVSHEGTGFDRG